MSQKVPQKIDFMQQAIIFLVQNLTIIHCRMFHIYKPDRLSRFIPTTPPDFGQKDSTPHIKYTASLFTLNRKNEQRLV